MYPNAVKRSSPTANTRTAVWSDATQPGLQLWIRAKADMAFVHRRPKAGRLRSCRRLWCLVRQPMQQHPIKDKNATNSNTTFSTWCSGLTCTQLPLRSCGAAAGSTLSNGHSLNEASKLYKNPTSSARENVVCLPILALVDAPNFP